MKTGDRRIFVTPAPYSTLGINTQPPSFIEVEFIDTLGGRRRFKGADGYMYVQHEHDRGFTRHIPDDEFEKLTESEKLEFLYELLWYDVANFRCPKHPDIDEEFSTKLHFCERHQVLFYEGQACSYCEHNKDRHESEMTNEVQHLWLGWYNRPAIKTIRVHWPVGDDVTIRFYDENNECVNTLVNFIYTDSVGHGHFRVDLLSKPASRDTNYDVSLFRISRNVARKLRKEVRVRCGKPNQQVPPEQFTTTFIHKM